MFIAKKNVVEYELRQTNAKEASDAVKRVDRFVQWASRTIEAAHPPRHALDSRAGG
jgi:hypothetical protein